MLRFTLDPILSLLLWLMAAFIVIGIGPMFFPIMGSTVSFAALLWKLLGATLLLVVNLALLRRAPGVTVLGRGQARTLSACWFSVHWAVCCWSGSGWPPFACSCPFISRLAQSPCASCSYPF